MSKATIEYDLSDPDDAVEFKQASRSMDMALALWKISQAWTKFKHLDKSQDFHDGVEAMNDIIYHCLREHNIDLDELT